MSPGKATVYKGRSGQWAFVLHRITGFLVFFFLLLHIVDVSLVNTRYYDEVHELYGNILLRLFECGLLLALLYHSLNGLRIVVIDFFTDGVRNQQALFYGVIVITLAAGLPGCFIILRPWLEGTF